MHSGKVGWLPSWRGAGRPGGWSGGVWVFLAPRHLALETPVFGGWKSLDFLGFSRPNLDLSMGYARFSREKFFARLFPWRRHDAATGAAVEAIRKRGIVHGVSLPRLLIFCKQLLSEPSPSGRFVVPANSGIQPALPRTPDSRFALRMTRRLSVTPSESMLLSRAPISRTGGRSRPASRRRGSRSLESIRAARRML